MRRNYVGAASLFCVLFVWSCANEFSESVDTVASKDASWVNVHAIAPEKKAQGGSFEEASQGNTVKPVGALGAQSISMDEARKGSERAIQESLREQGPEGLLVPGKQATLQRAYRVRASTEITGKGQRLADHLSEATQSQQGNMKAELPAKKARQSLSGRMSYDLAGKRPTGESYIRVHWEDEGSTLTDPDSSHSDLASKSFRYGLINELSRGPLYLELDSKNTIKSLWAHKEMSPDLVNIFLNVAEGIKIAWPASGQRDEWEAKEWDATGAYSAQYVQKLEASGTWQIEKTKLGYTMLPIRTKEARSQSLASSPDEIRVLQDISTFVWDPQQSRLISAKNSARIEVDGKYGSVATQSTLDLSEIDRAKVEIAPKKANIAELDAELDQYREFPLAAHLESTMELHSEAYRKRGLHPEEKANMKANWQGFLEEAHPVLAQQDPDRALLKPIARELKRMVSEHPPEALNLFRSYLSKTSYQTPMAALMMRAAIRYGGAEGEIFTGEVIRHPNVRRNFKSVGVLALGMSKKLTEAGEAVLHDLAVHGYTDIHGRIVTNQAVHSLANQVRKDNNPAMYERGVELLLSELQKADKPWRVVQLLGGLQNAGSPATLPVIQDHIEHDNKYIQLAAFEALRLIQRPEATELFLDTLIESWPDLYVRSRVVTLFEAMAINPDQWKRVDTYLHKEKRSAILADALVSVGAHGKYAIPLLKPFLNHQQEHIRKAAGQAIGRAQR